MAVRTLSASEERRSERHHCINALLSHRTTMGQHAALMLYSIHKPISNTSHLPMLPLLLPPQSENKNQQRIIKYCSGSLFFGCVIFFSFIFNLFLAAKLKVSLGWKCFIYASAGKMFFLRSELANKKCCEENHAICIFHFESARYLLVLLISRLYFCWLWFQGGKKYTFQTRRARWIMGDVIIFFVLPRKNCV